MARLVDADRLGSIMQDVEQYFRQSGFSDGSIPLDICKMIVEAVLNKSPTVDAVPVVRCWECKHRGNEINCPMCEMASTWDEDDGAEYYFVDRTHDDGFCHMGAKMDGGAE